MPFCSPFPVTEHTATGWWETKSYNVKWESHTQLLRVSIHSWSLNMLWASFLFMLFQIWRHNSHQDRMPSGSKHILNVGPNVRLMFCRSIRDWACYSSPLPALFLPRYNEMAAIWKSGNHRHHASPHFDVCFTIKNWRDKCL